MQIILLFAWESEETAFNLLSRLKELILQCLSVINAGRITIILGLFICFGYFYEMSSSVCLDMLSSIKL